MCTVSSDDGDNADSDNIDTICFICFDINCNQYYFYFNGNDNDNDIGQQHYHWRHAGASDDNAIDDEHNTNDNRADPIITERT